MPRRVCSSPVGLAVFIDSALGELNWRHPGIRDGRGVRSVLLDEHCIMDFVNDILRAVETSLAAFRRMNLRQVLHILQKFILVL